MYSSPSFSSPTHNTVHPPFSSSTILLPLLNIKNARTYQYKSTISSFIIRSPVILSMFAPRISNKIKKDEATEIEAKRCITRQQFG